MPLRLRSQFVAFVTSVAAAALCAPSGASAAGAVSLTATSYTVSESAGNAVITFRRTEATRRGQVRFGAWHRTAQQFQDYQPVKGRVDLARGQTEGSFTVPIVNDPLVEGRETIAVGIFGSYPERIAAPDRAILTIEDDDTVSTDPRDEANPLGLDPPPPPGDNPLHGARFYVNPGQTLAGAYANRIRGRQPRTAALLATIADQPEAKRFGSWNDRPRYVVSKYLSQAFHDDPGAIPLLSTYRLQHIRCNRVGDTPREAERYKRWYEQFAQGIGNQRVVVFYEIDALITAPCLSGRGLQTRIGEMRAAIDSLASLPHAVVYVDAGASDAHQPRFIGSLLRKVGVHKIQGFFTNATHQNRTTLEIRYANGLSRQAGGAHYVINTAANGKGALRPKRRVRSGNSIRCNARGRGLGPRPTWDVPPRYPLLDGVFWIGNPGRSAGNCDGSTGAPPTGTFWPGYALELIRNADYRIR